MQNYGCNGNLLCDHGVVERNRISSLQSHGKAFEQRNYYYVYGYSSSQSNLPRTQPSCDMLPLMVSLSVGRAPRAGC